MVRPTKHSGLAPPTPRAVCSTPQTAPVPTFIHADCYVSPNQRTVIQRPSTWGPEYGPLEFYCQACRLGIHPIHAKATVKS